MGETLLFYEKKYNNLYFTGYKKVKKKEFYSDEGLYVYNLKKEKIRLLKKAAKGYNLIAPYRIPETEKLIYINNGPKGVKEIYIRDIEK